MFIKDLVSFSVKCLIVTLVHFSIVFPSMNDLRHFIHSLYVLCWFSVTIVFFPVCTLLLIFL